MQVGTKSIREGWANVSEPQVLRPDPACWQEVRFPEPGLNLSICEMGVTTWDGPGGVKEVLGRKVLVTTTQAFLEAPHSRVLVVWGQGCKSPSRPRGCPLSTHLGASGSRV